MLTALGRLIGYVSDKPAHTAVAVILSAPFFGVIEFMVHEALAQLDVPPLVDALLDSFLVGCAFAFGVWALLAGNRERRARVRQDLERIAELNHEIRNALQIILHSQFGADPERRDMILESVTRIDGVLRRVFPVVGGQPALLRQ